MNDYGMSEICRGIGMLIIATNNLPNLLTEYTILSLFRKQLSYWLSLADNHIKTK